MPFIDLKTNCNITNETEEKIKSELGKAISLLGKSENWLMIQFEDNQKMYFQGKSDSNIAMIKVDLYGKASFDQYDQMTQKITEIISNTLSIVPSQIYVSYGEFDTWGMNGNNF